MSYKKKLCVYMSFNIKRHIHTSIISWWQVHACIPHIHTHTPIQSRWTPCAFTGMHLQSHWAPMHSQGCTLTQTPIKMPPSTSVTSTLPYPGFCVHVCVSVCMCVCTCVFACARVMCVCVCVCACMRAYVRACVCVQARMSCVFLRACVCARACERVRLCVCVRAFVFWFISRDSTIPLVSLTIHRDAPTIPLCSLCIHRELSAPSNWTPIKMPSSTSFPHPRFYVFILHISQETVIVRQSACVPGAGLNSSDILSPVGLPLPVMCCLLRQ